MRCTSPRTVGFQNDGKTLCWSKKTFSKEYATFQLPCGKCLECRLEYAREWAVRCVHEAQMHQNNIFLTLTYRDDALKSPKLVYKDFQLFMKKLRKVQDEPIGVFVTGEYGEENKRPHWHCILFNYSPRDGMYSHSSGRGDKLFYSETIDRIWGHGKHDFGEVTFESAGYVARYAAKKIVHGVGRKVAEADKHEWQPLSKKSNKHAIGKKWIERYWEYVFSMGKINLPNGSSCSIPRYYQKWFKENYPDHYLRYVTGKKLEISEAAVERARLENEAYMAENNRRLSEGKLTWTLSPLDRRRLITQSKFEMLQNHLKL